MDNPAARDIVPLYQRHAAAFARLRSQSLFEQLWLDKFLAAMARPGRVLDLGCGNGQPIGDYFIQQGVALTGVDGAEAMLSRARARFPAQRWLQHDMRTLTLCETFDGLLAWDSFFHLTQDDQRQMFSVFSRHIQPGSVLMFTSGTGDGIAMGQFEGEPLFHASLAPQEYRQRLAEIGFTVLEMKMEDPDCGGHTIWLAKATG